MALELEEEYIFQFPIWRIIAFDMNESLQFPSFLLQSRPGLIGDNFHAIFQLFWCLIAKVFDGIHFPYFPHTWIFFILVENQFSPTRCENWFFHIFLRFILFYFWQWEQL